MTSVLLHSPNWLGDVIMVLPALQAFHVEHPDVEIGVVCKKSVSALWKYCSVPINLHVYSDGFKEMLRVSLEIRSRKYNRAILAAHTPRAALLMKLSGVPKQRSFIRGINRLLVNDPVVRPVEMAEAHQSIEYGFLFEIAKLDNLQRARLVTPDVQLPDEAEKVLLEGAVALLPGAKRGPSKQWPSTRFTEVGIRLINELGKKVVLLGDPSEKTICEEIAQGICSPSVLSLAGKINFSQWLKVLSCCKCVICNDSGGMHVASALGTPVVAIFGITDPQKTGPFSSQSEVLQKSSRRSRAVPRISAEAVEALYRVTAEDVFFSVMKLMGESEKI